MLKWFRYFFLFCKLYWWHHPQTVSFIFTNKNYYIIWVHSEERKNYQFEYIITKWRKKCYHSRVPEVYIWVRNFSSISKFMMPIWIWLMFMEVMWCIFLMSSKTSRKPCEVGMWKSVWCEARMEMSLCHAIVHSQRFQINFFLSNPFHFLFGIEFMLCYFYRLLYWVSDSSS